MCRRVALRSSLRITLVLFIGLALLPAPFVSMLVAAMGQGRAPHTAPPRRGKPEGALPDLDDVKNESSIPKDNQDTRAILANRDYYDRELMKHCGPK